MPATCTRPQILCRTGFHVVMILTLTLTISCGRGEPPLDQARVIDALEPAPGADSEPPPDRPPAPEPPAATPPPSSSYKAEAPPLWEGKNLAAHSWTQHAFEIIAQHGPKLMMGTSDIKDFCPSYLSLAIQQKMNFWVYLISAMTKYESGFNPLNRYVETTMGIDPITKQKVVSEGLLQLSYQDKLVYPFCNEFDWSADSKLATNDPRRTILDPFKNLTCGIRILNQQVGKHDKIAVASGNYWSVIKTNSKYNKLVEIRALTKSIRFCHP